MALQNWTIDTVHSSVGFWVRHLMVAKVRGQFTKWSGTLAFDEQNPQASSVEVEIDAASIDTREPQRDGHLRSADFFDAEKYPKITFKSTRIQGAGSKLELVGDLTMHGVTKPVTLEVEFAGRAQHPQGGERAGFSAHGALNRKDWGLVWNQVLDAGGLALADTIQLDIEVEASAVAKAA